MVVAVEVAVETAAAVMVAAKAVVTLVMVAVVVEVDTERVHQLLASTRADAAECVHPARLALLVPQERPESVVLKDFQV